MNNDQFHYRNQKISTQNLIGRDILYQRLDFGEDPQAQELMIDTGSSWTWVDSINEDIPQNWTRNTLEFNEKLDDNLDCSEGERHTITYADENKIEGPLCTTTVKVHGTDEMKCRLPVVLRQNLKGWKPYQGGILGLAPFDYASGPLLVQHLYEQERLDRNMFSILPGKKAKITYGGY